LLICALTPLYKLKNPLTFQWARFPFSGTRYRITTTTITDEVAIDNALRMDEFSLTEKEASIVEIGISKYGRNGY